jgi:signal transduction histidine kinase/DNA-binding response OmpR family regulator
MATRDTNRSPPTAVRGKVESRRLPRWLYLYFLLAGCLLFVLFASLYFNRRIVDIQAYGAQVSRAWASRSDQYSELGQLAAEIAVPAKDVFESGEPDDETKELQSALQRFEQATIATRIDLNSNVAAQDALHLSEGLHAVNTNVRKMASEANQVFVNFNKEKSAAGKHMAAMDRLYKEVRIGIHELEQYVNEIEQRTFDEQERETTALTKWQYGLDALIAVLTIGVVAYAVILSRRITEAAAAAEYSMTLLQESEEALRQETAAAAQANQAKSNFLANMSHEIRTPMTAIMGYVELLLEPECGELERQDGLQVIRRSARHLLDLINDILDISKIEADKIKVERIPTDVPQIVADVASFMRPSAIAKGLNFNVTFGDRVPRKICSDPIRLKQVLFNLVGNALKFTSRGEIRVHVSCQVKNNVCITMFEVTDTGIGMTEEQTLRVFEPFTQADESTTRRFGGTGLGLTISKRLVQLLGGELIMKSLPGVGSAFQFTIDGGPVENIEMVHGFSESLLATPRSAADNVRIVLKGRVLLAEDGPDNQRLIAGHLRKTGAEVVVAENGRIAVDLAREQHFDLILMDMQMPELDGYSATRELRNLGCTLPIVALTAHAMAEDREKCLGAGCTDYLTKPIAKSDLLTSVANYLSHGKLTVPTSCLSTKPLEIAKSSAVVKSSFADDAAMAEALSEFVAALPERVMNICELLNGEHRMELRRLLHQLKGAGGGFGFDGITQLAAKAERSLKEDETLDTIRTEVNSLIALIRSIDGYQQSREGQPWLIQF